MLTKHLEPKETRTRFEIVIADDFSAHRSAPVRDLVWSKGAYLLILGGGVQVDGECGRNLDKALETHVLQLRRNRQKHQ